MTQTSRSMSLAMIGAAVVAAQFAAGKATRDALFFTSVPISALPAMVTATAVCSIALVIAHARAVRQFGPARLVPASFVISGVLFLVEWLLRARGPSISAIALYLHVSGAGPLLASGFWLIASETFNPRTAKKGFGRVAAAGTVGALIGALMAERIAAWWGGPSTLLLLSGLQFAAGWLVHQVASSGPAPVATLHGATLTSLPRMRNGLRLVAETPHLRTLSLLVLLGTTSAAVLDYLFKSQAVEMFGGGDRLMRFFALYYAGSSLVALLVQASTSRKMLERFGLGVTTSTPSLALLAGSVGGLLVPGFGSLLLARGGESVFRGSWFRAGYELFYTPMPAPERRAAKSVIDVAVDRAGDAVGAALVRMAIVLAPAAQSSVMLAIAMATAAAAVAAASRLHRWYLRSLETTLVDRAGVIDALESVDPSTAAVIRSMHEQAKATAESPATGSMHALTSADPTARDLFTLRSDDRGAIRKVLVRDVGLEAAVVPLVIPLLADDVLADYALFALRKVAEERVGQLTDALLDPNQPDAIRRRLARVFSVCVSQRAADGLLQALDDPRFDVRFQTARSLAAILARNPRLSVDRERIYRIVLHEVTVSRPVWESRRLLDGFVSASPLDAVVRDRAGQSLAHVFTLLSLVLPRDPLQIAFQSVHSDDAYLRGTALEYLEGVLPPAIKQRLWPFLVRPRHRAETPPDTRAIADLLRQSASATVQGIAGS